MLQELTFFSTGGTENFIKKLGINVEKSRFNFLPLNFRGRVKTLHPKVFGSILLLKT